MTNMAAPKFYVASQFGDIVEASLGGTNAYNTTKGIPRNVARRRCAAYQEMRHPAGRWRLPTKAEFEILCNLVYYNQIIDIIGEKSYWTADGIYKKGANGKAELVKNEGTEKEDTAFVRCVYDAWYWTDTVFDYHTFDNYNYFMWGDRIMQ